MTALQQAVVLILLTTGVLAHAHAHDPHWSFELFFLRSRTTQCSPPDLLNPEVVLIEGVCNTWADDEAFSHFIASFTTHRAWDEQDDYGVCQLRLFDEKHCAGAEVARQLAPNKRQNVDVCFNRFDAPARSVRLECAELPRWRPKSPLPPEPSPKGDE